MRQAKATAADLQAQAKETGQKASHLERQLVERGEECREMASLHRNLEELRTQTHRQEQRVTQSHREAQQSQSELASLEAILDLLHLREVETYTHVLSITLSFMFSMSWNAVHFYSVFMLNNLFYAIS